MKFLSLLLILLGCAKESCKIAVPVTFFCHNIGQLRYIEVNFWQGERVVRADVVYPAYFKDGIFKIKYTFYDTNPNLMVWRVYDINRTSKEYKTVIQ